MNHASDHTTAAVSLLRDRGYKVTDGRTRVLAELMRTHKPLAIDALSKRVPQINLVTIYRILERFVRDGIVYQADFRNGKAHFEYQPHHHHHITCTECGRMEAVRTCAEVEKHIAGIEMDHFDTIESHVLEFFGRCKQCKPVTT